MRGKVDNNKDRQMKTFDSNQDIKRSGIRINKQGDNKMDKAHHATTMVDEEMTTKSNE